MITVFTPTYNRAKLLPRLYESLCNQTFTDFEWLIVDDGSTDETEQTVQGFIDEHKIIIRYFKQPNGGKHRAINRGVREAKGGLFFIVDSDDLLPDDSLATIDEQWKQVKDIADCGGVCGLDAFINKTQQAGLPQQVIDCNALDIRYKYHVTGDLSEVFRTEALREFLFPEIEGERFCPEALVWNRIAQKYRLRYFNKTIYIAEYQNDGITDRIVQVRMQSPVASVTHYSELCSYDVPMKVKLKSAINYWRFHACLHHGSHAPKLPYRWLWAFPIGYMMHIKDKRF